MILTLCDSNEKTQTGSWRNVQQSRGNDYSQRSILRIFFLFSQFCFSEFKIIKTRRIKDGSLCFGVYRFPSSSSCSLMDDMPTVRISLLKSVYFLIRSHLYQIIVRRLFLIHKKRVYLF